jgi:hypothetical protein
MRKVASTITECVNSILRTKDVPENVDQRHLNTIITAASIAYRLPLPSGPVHRPEEWFLINCLAGYESIAGALNEYLVMDVNEVDKVVRTTWLLRYRVLHIPYSPQALEALMHTLGDSDYEVADVYRSWICALGDNSAAHVMMRVGQAMNENGVLAVETSDE